MKTLFALVGLPFSGKSTLLKAIHDNTNIQTISFDMFWQNLEKNMNENERRKLSYEYVTNLIDIEIAGLLKEGYSVVYDSLNDTPDQRDRLHNIAKSNDSLFKIIYLDIPLEVIKDRRRINEETKLRHSVNEDMFVKSIEKFTPPTTREIDYVLLFEQEDNISNWIGSNLANY